MGLATRKPDFVVCEQRSRIPACLNLLPKSSILGTSIRRRWYHYRSCLRVRYRTHRLRGFESGTGLLDTDSRGPAPDSEPRLWGMSRGPVVIKTTTDKSVDTGPYLHVYVLKFILPTKTSIPGNIIFVSRYTFIIYFAYSCAQPISLPRNMNLGPTLSHILSILVITF